MSVRNLSKRKKPVKIQHRSIKSLSKSRTLLIDGKESHSEGKQKKLWHPRTYGPSGLIKISLTEIDH